MLVKVSQCFDKGVSRTVLSVLMVSWQNCLRGRIPFPRGLFYCVYRMTDSSDTGVGEQQQLIPFSESDLEFIVRPERNIERWSNFLFPHARARNLDRKREKSWDIQLQNGSCVTAAIAITPEAGEKAYTYSTYDVYLALVSVFYDMGMPDTPMQISIRKLCRVMEVPMNGHWAKRVEEDLNKLFSTKLEWTLSYKTSENLHEEIGKNVRNQHILDTYDYSKLRQRVDTDKMRFETTVFVRFDENIRKNLKTNFVTPVNWAQRKRIKSQIGKVLLSRVDNIMAGQSRWERAGANLMDDLQLSDNARYMQYKSERRKILTRLQKEINNAVLSDGNVLIVALEETKSGDDYKLCFSKRNTKNSVRRSKKSLPIVNNDPAIIEYLVEEMGSVVGDMKKNYGLYKAFALHYSQTIIFRALGRWKEEVRTASISSKKKLFTIKMHETAHDMKKEWIKPCGKSCKYRPENRLQLFDC